MSTAVPDLPQAAPSPGTSEAAPTPDTPTPAAELPRQVDVVVAGGGPVGSTIALDLALRGVRVAVVEPELQISFDARARSLTARAMEHFRALGVAEEMHDDSPIPAAWYAGTSYRTSIAGRELYRTSPENTAAKRTVSAERLHHRLPQDRSNAIVRRAGTRAGVVLLLGWEAVDVTQDDEAATLHVRSRYGDGDAAIRARYVVGADGGRSVVRDAAGITFEESPFQGWQHSIIVRVPGVWEATGTTPNAFNWIWNDTLSDAFNPFEIDQYGLSIGPFDGDVELTEEDIAREVERRVGLPLPHETVRRSRYRLQKRVARRFRAGRVVIAGDAAHLFPPSLGMNLNTGITDASNLGWKLAAVVQGWAGDALLDSYDAERRIAADRVATAALQARACQDAMVAYLRGRPIPEGDRPGETAQRDEIVAHLRSLAFGPADGVAMDHRVDHSEVVIPDGTDADPWRPAGYEPIWRPGHRVPWSPLADGSSFYDHLGPGFTLVSRNASAAAVDALVEAAGRLGVPLSLVELGDQAPHPTARRLALVRPDQHLGWHADTLDAPPEQILDVLRGLTPRDGAPRLVHEASAPA